MAAEIIKVVDAVSEAKDVDRETIFEAIESALASATKKKYTDNMDVKVDIDRETGDYKTYRQWMVFADDSRELEDPDVELRMIDAVDVDKDANPGEFVREEIESVDFGRIGAQIAKQVIVQKVREAEKQKTIELFKDNIGELVSGVVKRMDRNGFYIDIGNNAEAFLPRREMIHKEAIRPQDRIKAILKDINTDLKGPPLILSRTMPEFLIELFLFSSCFLNELPIIGLMMYGKFCFAQIPTLATEGTTISNLEEFAALRIAFATVLGLKVTNVERFEKFSKDG